MEREERGELPLAESLNSGSGPAAPLRSVTGTGCRCLRKVFDMKRSDGMRIGVGTEPASIQRAGGRERDTCGQWALRTASTPDWEARGISCGPKLAAIDGSWPELRRGASQAQARANRAACAGLRAAIVLQRRAGPCCATRPSFSAGF